MSEVCVVGLGKIGLPLACAIAKGGHRVRGVDIDRSVVDRVNRAQEPFPGEADLGDALLEVTSSGALTAGSDTHAAVAVSDVVVIVVPLVVDGDAKPDFSAMDAATEAVGRAVRPGTLVSYETTLPVGTTRNRFAPQLRRLSNLDLGIDLFVVHSPERVFSGRIFEDLRRYPKLVGGIDEASTSRGVAFYGSFLEFDERTDLGRPNGVWNLETTEAAELAKLAETTYRDINIAFANELAIAAEGAGVDVSKVIEACNSQPFSHIHDPGIAVGGHCIPVYPHFLLASVDGVRLPALAREVNASMPARAVEVVEREIGGLEGATVLVLGIAYRAGVKEHAFSGAFALVHELRRRGARVVVSDPLYSDPELEALGFDPCHPDIDVDAVILHTAHADFDELGTSDFPGARVVFDGRRAVDPEKWRGTSLRVLGDGRAPTE